MRPGQVDDLPAIAIGRLAASGPGRSPQVDEDPLVIQPSQLPQRNPGPLEHVPSFIDIRVLEAATGHPVRSDYKQPDDPDVLPPPDAIAVAPATFNTVNKWAAGISDTLALGLLTEAIGKRLPIVALPFVNAAQAEHPAFYRSIEQLRDEGVRLLYGPDVLELHEPGTVTSVSRSFHGG
jgi:Flavoprotein